MLGRKSPFFLAFLLAVPSCRFGYEVLEQLRADPGPEEQPGDGDDSGLAGGTSLGGVALGGSPTSGGSDTGTGGTSQQGGAGAGGGSAGAPYVGEIPDPDPPPRLSAGQTHTCGVSQAGLLYCWGDNNSSALGGYNGTESSTPVLVSGEGSIGGFIGVSAGRNCSCALRDDGTVWCWGAGAEGQLGQGDDLDRTAPVQVNLSNPVRALTLAYRVACAIDDLGQLFCWGWNLEGQAGQGDTLAPVDASTPQLVPSNIPFADVSSGDGHVCAIRADGALFCWGRNTSGELGRSEPTQIRTPTRVGTDSDWIAIEAAQSQTCGIREDKSLWCWGAGDQGQLGIEPPQIVTTPTRVGGENDWVAVEPQALHGCGLKEDGTLWCWGRRQEGQLVVGYDPNPVLSPIAIDPNDDWDLVSAGRFHTCGRRAGTLYCTGENYDGRLGDGTLTRSYGFVPVQSF